MKELKDIREAEQLSQPDMAKECGIPLSTYRKYEQGISMPGMEALRQIADEFPHYALWLLTGKVDLPRHTSPEIVMQERREVGKQSKKAG